MPKITNSLVSNVIGELKKKSIDVGNGIEQLSLYDGIAYWKCGFIGEALIVDSGNVVTYVNQFDIDLFKKHCDLFGIIICRDNISTPESEVWEKLSAQKEYFVMNEGDIIIDEKNFKKEFFSEYKTYMVKRD